VSAEHALPSGTRSSPPFPVFSQAVRRVRRPVGAAEIDDAHESIQPGRDHPSIPGIVWSRASDEPLLAGVGHA
jgi:hypothetical protein